MSSDNFISTPFRLDTSRFIVIHTTKSFAILSICHLTFFFFVVSFYLFCFRFLFFIEASQLHIKSIHSTKPNMEIKGCQKRHYTIFFHDVSNWINVGSDASKNLYITIYFYGQVFHVILCSWHSWIIGATTTTTASVSVLCSCILWSRHSQAMSNSYYFDKIPCENI